MRKDYSEVMDKVLTFTDPQGNQMNVNIVFNYDYDSITGKEAIGIWSINPEHDWLTMDMVIESIFNSL
jgi:hypothetical protein